jgi:D-glycero-alpha-D-manno-heptose-7-phosphate kinase
MIITKTPFRFTLGGGGTDLPSYYSKYGGFIFAAGLSKYMYISVNQPFDGLVRVKYSESETVKHRDEVKHGIAREAMRMLGFETGIEITSTADLPAGTGLGSSSCYAVGLLNALHAIKREYVPLPDLAEEACELEIEILRSPIGKQDQYMASFGGLTILAISKDGVVEVRSARVDDSVIDDLNRNLLMFYTNTQRSANEILSGQSRGVQQGRQDVVESMHTIKEIGYKVLDAVESGNLTDVGLLFDEHWQYKKKISKKMSNPHFDELYVMAKENGALGGKITGAGGGGFFLFYVEGDHHRFIEKMECLGLKPLRYRFDFEGTKVLINLRDGGSRSPSGPVEKNHCKSGKLIVADASTSDPRD